jgi:hypothetical protein
MDAGVRDGASSGERACIKDPEREVKERLKAYKAQKQASVFCLGGA